MREVVDDLVKAQESMEYNILQKLRYEFSKQKLAVAVREDARAEQINNIVELRRQQIDALSLPSAPVQLTPQIQRNVQSSKATPSMSEFTFVKEDLSQIETVVQKLQSTMQFTFNNTVDMPGLAEQINIISASHDALFTILQEVNDAKMGKGRGEKRQDMLLSTNQSQELRPLHHHWHLFLSQELKNLLNQHQPLQMHIWKLKERNGMGTKCQIGRITRFQSSGEEKEESV